MTTRHGLLLCLLLPLLGACGDSSGGAEVDVLPLTGETWSFLSSDMGSMRGLQAVSATVVPGQESFIVFASADDEAAEPSTSHLLYQDYTGDHVWARLTDDPAMPIDSIHVVSGEFSLLISIEKLKQQSIVITLAASDGSETVRHAGDDLLIPWPAGAFGGASSKPDAQAGIRDTQIGASVPRSVWEQMSKREQREYNALAQTILANTAAAAMGASACNFSAVAGPVAWTACQVVNLAIADAQNDAANKRRRLLIEDVKRRLEEDRDLRDPREVVEEHGAQTRERTCPTGTLLPCVGEEAAPGDPERTRDTSFVPDTHAECNAACLYRDFPTLYVNVPYAALAINPFGNQGQPPEGIDEHNGLLDSPSLTCGPLIFEVSMDGTQTSGNGSITCETMTLSGSGSGYTGAVDVNFAAEATIRPLSAQYAMGMTLEVYVPKRLSRAFVERYVDFSILPTWMPDEGVRFTGYSIAGTGLERVGVCTGTFTLPHPECPGETEEYCRFAVGITFFSFDTNDGGDEEPLMFETGGTMRVRLYSGGMVTVPPQRKPGVSAPTNVEVPDEAPVVDARFEMGGEDGDVPVLVFDQLYDPDDFDGAPATGFRRGITGVETRVLGGTVDPASAFNSLPSGTYDIEVKVWDNDANSTSVTVPLTIP